MESRGGSNEKKDGGFEDAGTLEEDVPADNPWTNPKAWAKTEVQAPIKQSGEEALMIAVRGA